MEFNSADISKLLPLAESVVMKDSPERGSARWSHGYTIDAIDGLEPGSDAVVLAIEEDGSSEAVLIVNDIELSVTTIKGKGYAVIANVDTPDPQVRVVALKESDDTSLKLTKGDVYYYRAVDGPLVLRDQSTPEFTDGDEITMSDEGRNIKLPPSFWRAYDRELASKLNPLV